jgi:hypothetical protein
MCYNENIQGTIMTKTIRVTPRTGGNATYNDMIKEDMAWVMAQLERAMVEANARSISKNQLDKNLWDLWTIPNPDLGFSPYNNSMNSMASVVGGIFQNMKLGMTKDLTDKNCDKIEIIFDLLVTGAQKGLLTNIKMSRVKFIRYDERDPADNFSKMFAPV